MPTQAFSTNRSTRKSYGVDTEGWLIQPGRCAPDLVCTSICPPTGIPEIYDRAESVEPVQALALDDKALLVLHNAPHDMGTFIQADILTFAKVFSMYERERIADTLIWQKLWMIKCGWADYDPKMNQKPPRYSLDNVTQYWLEEHISGKYGDDSWRLRYHELADVPIEQWPQEAKNYALYDSTYPKRVWEVMTSKEGVLPDFWRQMNYAWALHLFHSRGLRTQEAVVREVELNVVNHIDDVVGQLLERGIYRLGGTKAAPKATLNTKIVMDKVEKYFESIGEPCPRTPPSTKFPNGQVKKDKEILEMVDGDEDIKLLLEVGNDMKLQSTYLNWALVGTEWPVCASYDSLKETGRSSAYDPNIQNQPRKGGIRECYVPREGYIFVDCDYNIAELRSLSQVLINMYGYSQMAETIKAADIRGHGYDIHCLMAAAIMGISLDEFAPRFIKGDKICKEMRQLAKAINFGVPGGLGAKTLVTYAWVSFQVRMTPDEAKEYIALYKRTFPEMERYFTDIGAQTGFGGKFDMIQHGSGRIRGQVGFCDGANGNFQALTADGAKMACWYVAKECYTGIPYSTSCEDALEAYAASDAPSYHDWVMSLPECPADSVGSPVGGDAMMRSPLYGSFPVWFIHDEIGLESPFHLARGAAKRLSTCMVEAMELFTPDVKSIAEADMRRRWYKAAEAEYEDGELVPWTPKKPRKVLAKMLEKEKPEMKEQLVGLLAGLADEGHYDAPWSEMELEAVERLFPPPAKDPKQWKDLNQMWRWELLARERNPDPWC